MSIPLYSADGAFRDYITERTARRMAADGHAKLVTHRRKGYINRVVMYRRAGDPPPSTLRDYGGQRYVFPQRKWVTLSPGRACWKLKPLGESHSDSDLILAPPETRSVFLAVVLGCMEFA